MKIRNRVATGAVASVLMLGSAAALTAAAPASAAARPQIKNDLTCTTTTDGRRGTADCTNNTNRTIAFRATVVCGLWPDTTGPWRTLNPGARDHSEATCDGGTGVGSVGWEEG